MKSVQEPHTPHGSGRLLGSRGGKGPPRGSSNGVPALGGVKPHREAAEKSARAQSARHPSQAADPGLVPQSLAGRWLPSAI